MHNRHLHIRITHVDLKPTHFTEKADSRQINKADSRQINKADSRQINQADSRQIKKADSRQINKQTTGRLKKADNRQINKADTSLPCSRRHEHPCICYVYKPNDGVVRQALARYVKAR